MQENRETGRCTQLIDESDVQFFRLLHVLEHGRLNPNDKPLRRTLSLMRKRKFQSMVHEVVDWKICCCDIKCSDRFDSCKKYILTLNKYDLKLVSKTCHKLLFFSEKINCLEELDKTPNDLLMAYCIVHQDKLCRNGKLLNSPHIYLSESIIKDPPNGSFAFGAGKHKINVNGGSFEIVGNYFSQQNAITNSCAHAAIKMAIRTHTSDVRAEKINEVVGIDHVKKKGYKGLTSGEIANAITKLSGLNSYLLKSDSLASPLDFLKVIFLAIESRMPVILIFPTANEESIETYCHSLEALELPPTYDSNTLDHKLSQLDEKKAKTLLREVLEPCVSDHAGEEDNIHAVTLIGHTINKHSWYAYGIGDYYLRDSKVVEPLSSYLWCDNFIIQDDNFGPYYLLPSRFILDLIGAGTIISTLGDLTHLPVEPRETWVNDMPEALIVHQKKFQFPENLFLIEPWAYLRLSKLIEKLDKSKRLPTEDDFDIYFYNYFKDPRFGQKTSLIFRTTIVSRDDYIKSLDYIYRSNKLITALREHLPHTFCVTELSLPELYWANDSKVGEIITDPTIFNEDYQNGVIFIRIPFMAVFVKDRDFVPVNILHDDVHQKLLEATGV